MVDTQMSRSAELSRCGTYRYWLRRSWCVLGQQPDRVLGWIMLNPSTADATLDDPTIRRCVAFAKAWGHDGIVVRNLYALRATDPAELRRHEDPVGPANNLGRTAEDALTICAWGADGAWQDRGSRVAQRLSSLGVRLYHMGLTKAGQPRHPLYLRGDVQPTRWEVQSDG